MVRQIGAGSFHARLTTSACALVLPRKYAKNAFPVIPDFLPIFRHEDGGVLIGKVYGHLANKHRKAMAGWMNFEPAQLNQTNPPDMPESRLTTLFRIWRVDKAMLELLRRN